MGRDGLSLPGVNSMVSRYLDNKPLGRVLNFVGNGVFVCCLLIVAIEAYLIRDRLATKVEQGALQLPMALIVIGIAIFLAPKLFQIRSGNKALVSCVGWVLMAVGVGWTWFSI